MRIQVVMRIFLSGIILYLPLLFTAPAAAKAPAVPKEPPPLHKGLAHVYAPEMCGDITTLGASWYYNWGGSLSCPPPGTTAEFVPMAWGGAHPEWWPKAGYTSSAWLMGFNEPDLGGQANLTPEAAARIWHDQIEVVFAGKLLLSPAPSHAHPDWIVQFRDAYQALYGHYPRLDGLAAHCYGTLTFCEGMVQQFEGWASAWGVGQIWLTEFALFSPASDLETFLTWLDGRPLVKRYAYFTNRDNGNEPWSGYMPVLMDYSSGALTDYGRVYVGH